MCDYIRRLLTCLEPIIIDLDSRKEELDNLKQELDNVRDFLHYVENDIKKIGKYTNQKFIHDNLTNLDSENSEYQAMIYLAESNSPNIQKMPQYQSAINYLKNLLEYFDISEKSFSKIFKELSDEYYYKSTAKKYYDLFQSDDTYIQDYDEFIEFFMTIDIDVKDRIDILSYVIKSNVNYYKNNTNENLEVDRRQELMKIQEIIHDNKSLLSDKYDNFLDGVNKRVDLTLNMKKIVNEELLEKIDINNLILAKIIYLIKKITQNYKACEFGLVSKYIKEYDETINIKEKIKNINNKDEIIKVVRGGY